MSTTTGPDLTAGREAVERLMDDTIRLTVETDADDWTLDPVTLRLTPPAATVVYEGRCKIKNLSSPSGQAEEGGQILGLDAYRIDLPVDSVRIPEGAVGVLTSSRRFPAAVGEVYAVKRLITKTLAVQASYAAERRAVVEGTIGGGTTPILTLVEDPDDAGTYLGTLLTEDTTDAGTFLGALTPDPADPGTYLIGA